MRQDLAQDVFIEHREFIAAEWEAGNRTPKILQTGELICIPSKKYKRLKKNEKKRARNAKKGGFIIALFAERLGKTVEDLFLEYMYNNTYEMINDYE